MKNLKWNLVILAVAIAGALVAVTVDDNLAKKSAIKQRAEFYKTIQARMGTEIEWSVVAEPKHDARVSENETYVLCKANGITIFTVNRTGGGRKPEGEGWRLSRQDVDLKTEACGEPKEKVLARIRAAGIKI